MRRVYKYPVPIVDEIVVNMPAGAAIVHVGHQHHMLVLWADVDDSAPNEPRSFSIRGTGHEVDPGARYVDTVQMPTGDPPEGLSATWLPEFVWHVFELEAR
jgi:hypothetical protein